MFRSHSIANRMLQFDFILIWRMWCVCVCGRVCAILLDRVPFSHTQIHVRLFADVCVCVHTMSFAQPPLVLAQTVHIAAIAI